MALDGERGDLLAQGVGLALDVLDALERGGELAAGGLGLALAVALEALERLGELGLDGCGGRLLLGADALDLGGELGGPGLRAALWLRSGSARRASICCVASSARRVASATALGALLRGAHGLGEAGVRGGGGLGGLRAAALDLVEAGGELGAGGLGGGERLAEVVAGLLVVERGALEALDARERLEVRLGGVGREGVEALLELGAQRWASRSAAAARLLGVAAGLVELRGQAVGHPLEVVDALERREQARDDRGGVVEVVDVLPWMPGSGLVRRSSVSASAAARAASRRGELGARPTGSASSGRKTTSVPAVRQPSHGCGSSSIAWRSARTTTGCCWRMRISIRFMRQLEAQVLEEQREVEALVELDGDEDGLHRELWPSACAAVTLTRPGTCGGSPSSRKRAPGLRLRASTARRSACRRRTARGRPGPGGRTAARPARTTWRPSPGRR